MALTRLIEDGVVKVDSVNGASYPRFEVQRPLMPGHFWRGRVSSSLESGADNATKMTVRVPGVVAFCSGAR